MIAIVVKRGRKGEREKGERRIIKGERRKREESERIRREGERVFSVILALSDARSIRSKTNKKFLKQDFGNGGPNHKFVNFINFY